MNPRRTKILIFETSLSGHHAYYLKILIEAFEALGIRPTVALPKSWQTSAQGQTYLADLDNRFDAIELDYIPTGHVARLKLYRRIATDINPTRAYIPYVDGIIQAMSVPSGFRGHVAPYLEALSMRGAFAYPIQGIMPKLKHAVSRLAVQRARIHRLHHLDPIVAAAINQKGGCRGNPVNVMPEAIPATLNIDPDDARNQLGLTGTGPIIICPGQINHRKGSHLLLSAFARANMDGAQLVLLGTTSAALQGLITSKYQTLLQQRRLIWENRFLTNSEFDLLFAASNLVCIPYPKHVGSASILIRAAKSKKRILASHRGWIGWATRAFNLGKTVDVENIDQFQTSIVDCLNETNPSMGSSALKQQFLDFHSEENQKAHWTEDVCESTGMTSTHKIIRWTDVVTNEQRVDYRDLF